MNARSIRIGKPVWELSVWRMAIFIVLVFLAIFFVVCRLIEVQLVQGSAFRAAAQANQIRLIQVAAPRGMIYDDGHHVLVRSRPAFQVALIPSLVKDVDGEMHTVAVML